MDTKDMKDMKKALLVRFIMIAFVAAGGAWLAEANGKTPAPKGRPAFAFGDDFESGSLDKWSSSRDVEIVSVDGGNRCRIEAGRGELMLNLPGRKLQGRRLVIRFRYRMSASKGGKGNVGGRLHLVWMDNGYHKGARQYGNASITPSVDKWAVFEKIVDFSKSVADATLRIRCTGRGSMLIDDVRMQSEPQEFAPVVGYARAQRGRLIFEDNFDGDLSNWIHEGVGKAEVKGGRLRVFVTPDHSEMRGQNLWLKKKLPSDFIVEMRVRPLAPDPKAKITANLLYFFSATRKGGDLLGTTAQRDGRYGAYIGKKAIIPCYTLTWYRLNDPEFVIARRNPGWGELARSFPPTPAPGKDYTLEIEKRGGEILFVENGVGILLVRDSQPPLGEGYFALRAWHAEASYDYVRIYEAKPPAEGSSQSLPAPK